MRGSVLIALIIEDNGLYVCIIFKCLSMLSTTDLGSISAELFAEYRIFKYSQRNNVVIVLKTTSLL